MSTTQPATKNQQPVGPKRFTCRHIFHDGHRCGSPALRGDRLFCFYHRSTPRPDPPAASTDPEVKFAGPSFAELLLPLPEDRAAIQTGIGIVMRAIGSAKIDIRRANGLLAALKLATQNLPPHPKERVDPAPPVAGSSNRPTKNEQPQKSAEMVDEIELSPDLGPLAPILEYGLPEPQSEEEREPSLAQIIDAWIKSPPEPEPVPLEKRPYDFDTLQLLRRTLATTENPETAARIRKALEEEALLPGNNLHIQACAEEPTDPGCGFETGGRPIHSSLTAMSGESAPTPEVAPLDPPQDQPANLQRRCRTVRRAFLPRSARPLPPNLPTPTPPRPPAANKRPITLPTLHAVADPRVQAHVKSSWASKRGKPREVPNYSVPPRVSAQCRRRIFSRHHADRPAHRHK